METILGFFVSGFWAVLKALFGKSDAEKLGNAETTLTQQAKALTEAEDAKAIRDRVDNQPIGAANAWLHHPSFYD